jgi:hydantoinase/carbamoylase family amidase
MIKADGKRIEQEIKHIATFNSTPSNGTTRFSYSPEDRSVRDYLIAEMESIGLIVKTDPVGNIRGRLRGSEDSWPVVMTGSHIDTVTNGGNFDGVAGVVAGLEAIRSIVESGIQTKHPLELIVFVEEEGPNFNFPLAGSRLLTGSYPVEAIRTYYNAQGISMYDAAVAFGFDPKSMPAHVIDENEIKAMIELHIEQSVMLDELTIPVGVVEAVAGRKWIEFTIWGKSNHAGATPMRFRSDPMVGAARIIASLKDLVVEEAFETTVGTVGRIECDPNEPNVIPEKVIFTVDVRDTDPKGIEIVENALALLTKKVCEEYGLIYKIEELSQTEPIVFAENVVNAIEASAIERSINHVRMNSGALHDACLMGRVTDVGMIFVPSIDGRSHCAQENTNFDHIKIGTDVLIGALLELAGI